MEACVVKPVKLRTQNIQYIEFKYWNTQEILVFPKIKKMNSRENLMQIRLHRVTTQAKIRGN